MAIDYDAIAEAGGLPKGEDHWLSGRKRRKAIADFEEREKAKVRKRDRICRWPRCANCSGWRPPLEVAHVRAKGMGGDHSERSTADRMILLDKLTHREQETHKRDVRPLTNEGTWGPCEFWQQERDGWFLVARELAPFVYERD